MLDFSLSCRSGLCSMANSTGQSQKFMELSLHRDNLRAM